MALDPSASEAAAALVQKGREQALEQPTPEQLAERGWVPIECPVCGSSALGFKPQPKQEPVAWQGVYDPTDLYWRKPPQTDVRPLYTAPQPAKREPLTLWTEAQHERAYRNSPELHKDVKSLAAFKRVAKEIAAMYGITEGAK